MAEQEDLFLGLVHQVIDDFLIGGEFAGGRESAGDIGGIAMIFGAYIHQHQVFADMRFGIFFIMQDTKPLAPAPTMEG